MDMVLYWLFAVETQLTPSSQSAFYCLYLSDASCLLQRFTLQVQYSYIDGCGHLHRDTSSSLTEYRCDQLDLQRCLWRHDQHALRYVTLFIWTLSDDESIVADITNSPRYTILFYREDCDGYTRVKSIAGSFLIWKLKWINYRKVTHRSKYCGRDQIRWSRLRWVNFSGQQCQRERHATWDVAITGNYCDSDCQEMILSENIIFKGQQINYF